MLPNASFAGAVRYNVPKSCATRSCCACGDPPICVAVMYLTLRTGCEKHGRKNPLPFPFSERSHIGNLRRIRKQGKGRSSKRKEKRRLSFLFAPAAGAATLPPSADGKSPAESQRKTSRPERTNTLTQFACPGQSLPRNFEIQKRLRICSRAFFYAISAQINRLPLPSAPQPYRYSPT